MTETLVPLGRLDLDAGRRMASGRRGSSTERKWIKTTLTSTSKKSSPRALVLNKEKMFMKLDKDIIIRNKTING
jgi:hypothetical protein